MLLRIGVVKQEMTSTTILEEEFIILQRHDPLKATEKEIFKLLGTRIIRH